MKNSFERNPYREFPDGSIRRLHPFHISLEGLETRILCRDNEDYDVFVKIICVCCRRKGVVLVIYSVVSNHAHGVVLATCQEAADDCAEEIKRIYAMYFSKKYGDNSVMKGVDAKALWINTDWYLRNALAYDIRNAMDNGAQCVQSYKWTGFRGMFCNGKCRNPIKKVRDMSKREIRRIMHTGDDLSDVRWIVDENGELEPASICDWNYLEGAFLHDQSFFLKSIGTVNTAEMNEKLIDSPRRKRKDEEFLRTVEEISQNWYNTSVHFLSTEKKARLISYIKHSIRTDIPQLCRTFEIDRETMERLLRK